MLDFDGSLASTYFQNRAFLSCLPYVCWNIVEKPQHVTVGKECFEDKELRFYPSIKYLMIFPSTEFVGNSIIALLYYLWKYI